MSTAAIVRPGYRDCTKDAPCQICGRERFCSRNEVWLKCRNDELPHADARKSGSDKLGPYWLYLSPDAPPDALDRGRGREQRATAPAPRKAAKPRTDAGRLNAVYSLMLKNMRLSRKWQNNLRSRGLSFGAIARNDYRSLPSKADQVAIQKRLIETVPDAADTVPGIAPDRPFGRPGQLIVPVRDLHGRIVGLKLRRDGNGQGPKYYWLSSARHGGPGPGNPVHFPLGTPATCDMVRATEGELKSDAAFHISKVPTISCPGVGSWKSLLPAIAAMQAKTVVIAFDADASAKPAVAAAQLDLLQELQRQGYAIAVERWPVDEAGEPKGIDDCFARGKQETIETLYGDDAINHARACVATAGANTTEGEAAGAGDRLARRPIVVVNDRPQSEIFDDMMAIISGVGEYYSREAALWHITSIAARQLSHVTLQAEFSRYADAVETRKTKDGLAYETIPILPGEQAKLLLNRPDLIERLPRVSMLTSNPGFDDQWRLYQPGYNTESGIYYQGPPIDPSASLDHINALLCDFCWRDESDRTNYIGVLLTGLLMRRFIGSHPMLLLNGSQPGLGKTLLAQLVGILRDGRECVSVTYTANDEELEKQIGAQINSGAKTVLFDNARIDRGRIQSGVLERSITDRILNFRLLGTSRPIQCENSIQFAITVNHAKSSPDLLSRSIVVNLQHDGDPRHRRFTLDDPITYAKTHRSDINAELLGMVERWKSAGCPMADVSTRFNRDGWGRIIGGILACSGLNGFLSNADAAADEIDDERSAMRALLESMHDHRIGPIRAAEAVEHADQCCPDMAELLRGKNDRARATKFSRIAGRFVGVPLGDESQPLTLRAEDPTRGRGKLYSVESAPLKTLPQDDVTTAHGDAPEPLQDDATHDGPLAHLIAHIVERTPPQSQGLKISQRWAWAKFQERGLAGVDGLSSEQELRDRLNASLGIVRDTSGKPWQLQAGGDGWILLPS